MKCEILDVSKNGDLAKCITLNLFFMLQDLIERKWPISPNYTNEKHHYV